MKISVPVARRLAIQCQGLDGQWRLPAGKEGVAQAIERLGYVQIDTIAVVKRAHHHTIWTRCPDYDPQMLHELQAQDRRVFEYWWAWGASYLPMCDYRYYLLQMHASAERPETRQWLQANAQLVEYVMKRIREEGPLGSADFEAPPGFERGSWWSWKPAKEALETLFWMGDLMITERRNFQRVYDLTERVLPPGIDATEPSRDEAGRFFVRRILASHGVASAREMQRASTGWRKVISKAVEELADSGEATAVEIEGLDNQTYYALTEIVEKARISEIQPTWDVRQVCILSPFDNLVIHRERLKQLFGFAYSLECYLPAAKRRYGYFSLPILWGTRFVARLDAKADREQKTLIVHVLIFEPGCDNDDELLPALATKLRAFAAFNGCGQILIERTEPEKMRIPLMQELGGIP